MSSPLNKISDENLNKIADGLKENREKLNKYVELFKEWVKSEKHLPHDVETSFIENFIRLCKYDFEKVKSKFESYIITKNSLEHLKSSHKIKKEDFERDDISKGFIIGPDLTPDLNRIFYLWGTKNQQNFNYKLRHKYIIDLAEWFLHTGLNVGTGFIIIINFECFTVELLSKIDLNIERRYMKLTINCFPAIIKEVHLINVPAIAKPLISIFKSIASEKIQKRMIFHNDINDLKKYIPSENLPIELNGTSGKSLDDWAKNWEDFYMESEEIQEKCKKLHLYGEVPKNKVYLDCSSGFGVNGSFRQLKLD